MSAHVRIRGEKPRREPAQRHEPSAILQLDARRARPNPCLIEHEMFWRMLQIVLIPIAIRRRWRSDRVFRSRGACRGCLMFRILGRASLRVLRRAGRYRLSVRHAARDHDSSRQTSHTEPSNHREPPNCRGSAFCAPRLACKYGFCDVMLFLDAASCGPSRLVMEREQNRGRQRRRNLRGRKEVLPCEWSSCGGLLRHHYRIARLQRLSERTAAPEAFLPAEYRSISAHNENRLLVREIGRPASLLEVPLGAFPRPV